ncbi:unnamed protein product [Rotaria sp. Silwood1]|nr:unnamed protein product [Rotaria sp. Silwood1]CAF4621602.1 unnamed protein product [Rotaria sp. Silwood1]
MAKDDGKVDERLHIRLERALKNFGLNENAGIVQENNPREYNVILAGPPRGGKTTLIGSLCGQGLNATNIRLASRKKEVSCFVKTDQRKGLPHTVTFWSTVGLEPWTKDAVKSYVHDIVQIHAPIFLLFCASPITVIEKDHLSWLIESCIEENIFCALVHTNIYARARRNITVQTFKDVLQHWSANGCSLIPTASDSTKPYASSVTSYNHSETKQPMALVCQLRIN